MRIISLALGLSAAIAATGALTDAVAQDSGSAERPRAVLRTTAPAPAPFGVGERAAYRVGYGMFRNVGSGSMEIVGVDTVNGAVAYHTHFRLRGGIPGARVNNTFDSWLDVTGLFSRRFEQDTHEVRFKRRRVRDFFPEEGRWVGHTNDRLEQGELETVTPLDDTSFLYFVRTLRLDVGDVYELDSYWNPDGNPVIIRVLRRETVTVPAGTFQTLVVQPVIKTSGMFSEGGEAEVYLSDDADRILVMLRARVPFGSLRLELEEYTPGTPLVR